MIHQDIARALQTKQPVVIVRQPVSVYIGQTAILVSRELAKQPMERVVKTVESALKARSQLTPEDAEKFQLSRTLRRFSEDTSTAYPTGRKCAVEPKDPRMKICLGCQRMFERSFLNGQSECPQCKRKTESHRYVEKIRQATGQELLFEL